MIKQKTLIDFEHVRAGYKLIGDNWIMPVDPITIIPPQSSNSFYDIGNGSVDIYSISDNPNNYKLGISIHSGIINTGIGSFQVDGNDDITFSHYKYMNIKENSELIINNNLTLIRATITNYGTLSIDSLASLILRDGSIFNSSNNSVININKESFIFIDEKSQLNLYGTINIHIDKIETILNQSNIYIDPTTVINIIGINNSNREYSLQDYIKEIHSKVVNINTTQEKNFNNSRVVCKWTDGTPINNSHSINIYCESGKIISGDLKVSFLGLNETLNQSMKTLSNLIINENATLIVSEDYNNNHWYYPSLYIGVYIDNNKVPAKAIINGTLLVDGSNSSILLDRNGSMIINGTVKLSNKAKLKVTNSDQNILTINGTLIIDTLDQLVDFNKDHIQFGSKGKLVILNPSTNIDQVILEIPNGIKSSKLYELFEDRLEHIEFHITEKTGIKIDTYLNNYPLEMKHWYSNYSLSDAIKNSLIIWEDNGFIELNHEIIKWINFSSNLSDLTKLFISSGLNYREELQSIVDKFVEAKSGDIRFKFIEGNLKKEIILHIHIPEIKSAYYDRYNNDYVIQVSDQAYLFISNNINKLKGSKIVEQAKHVQTLLTEYNHFKLQ